MAHERARAELPSGPEDVRRIAGIGTRFEAALRKQGITSIRQIAAWSDADVRQVAKALKIPKSRIVKGGWIEAAREMIGSRSTSE
jgi:NADH-quinone oxidoreductase subunit E